MLNISNQNLKKSVINNQKLFFELINKIGLEKKWNKTNFLKIEIKKSFIRGILRYSAEATNLSNLIVNQIKSYNELNNFYYYTRVYPMIHLSEDLSEESQLHFDQHDNNNLLTCWLPITENNYSPISVLKYQNKYFKNLFSKIRFPNLMMNSIYPKIGELNFWDGHFLHKGNYNHSEKISCAFQMKFTEKKYEYELSIKKDDLLKEELLEETISLNFKNLIILTSEINKINFKNNFYEQFSKIVDILKNLFNKKNPEISFALSVLAQRIKIHGKRFDVQNYLYKSYLYDICSILLGCENFISLKRMIQFEKKNTFKALKFLDKNDFLGIMPNKIGFIKNKNLN